MKKSTAIFFGVILLAAFFISACAKKKQPGGTGTDKHSLHTRYTHDYTHASIRKYMA